jgi:uncharacterized protein (DUF1015 family)
MAKVRPFRAIRFDERVAGPIGKLCSPPYDIISPAEQDALYEMSLHNIVRLELSRGENRYETAAATLKEWLSQPFLVNHLSKSTVR